MMCSRCLIALLVAVGAACALDTHTLMQGPVAAASPRQGRNPYASYSYRATRPPVAELIRDEQVREPAPEDPLTLVLFGGGAPENDKVVQAVKAKLEANRKAGLVVEWLDSAKPQDRFLLGEIFNYCTKVFAQRGTERDCIVQCHPKADCGQQAARLCLPLRKDNDPYIRCIDREMAWCGKYGIFTGERYPNFRPKSVVEKQKVEEVLEYCGNIFQMRGVRLPCLRTCTVFMMKHNNPDLYYYWRAKHQVQYHWPDKDPSESEDPDANLHVQCEDTALSLCRFTQQQFWRECYERIKFNCLKQTGMWNDLVAS